MEDDHHLSSKRGVCLHQYWFRSTQLEGGGGLKASLKNNTERTDTIIKNIYDLKIIALIIENISTDQQNYNDSPQYLVRCDAITTITLRWRPRF